MLNYGLIIIRNMYVSTFPFVPCILVKSTFVHFNRLLEFFYICLENKMFVFEYHLDNSFSTFIVLQKYAVYYFMPQCFEFETDSAIHG